MPHPVRHPHPFRHLLRKVGVILTAGLALFGAPVMAQPRPTTQSTAASAATTRPPLWVIQKGRATATLFGTIHMLPRNVAWFDATMAHALDSANTLLLEAVPPKDPEALVPLQQKYARLAAPSPVMARVPPQLRPVLASSIKRLNPNLLQWYKDWYIALLVSVDAMQDAGFEVGLGAESVLAARAQIRQIPVEGLETAEQQLIYFASLDDKEQHDLLISTLEKKMENPDSPDTLVRQWLGGETDALARDLNAEFSRTPALRKILVTDRNARWAAEIARRIKTPGNLFIAVGAGHFAGDGNLLDALRAQGLKPRLVTGPERR